MLHLDDALVAHDAHAGPLGQALGAGALHRLLGHLVRLAALLGAPVPLAAHTLAVVVALVYERLAVLACSWKG